MASESANRERLVTPREYIYSTFIIESQLFVLKIYIFLLQGEMEEFPVLLLNYRTNIATRSIDFSNTI